jgi:hypothetical protein
VEAVRRHPGSIETSRQFSREQDVGQLGFAVTAKAPIGALGVEIVERDVGSLMRLGCALLNREIVKIVRLSDIKERMAELGYEPVGGTPEELAKQIKLDLEKWSAVIRDAQIKVR